MLRRGTACIVRVHGGPWRARPVAAARACSGETGQPAAASAVAGVSASSAKGRQGASVFSLGGEERERLDTMWRLHQRGGGRAQPGDQWVPRLSAELEALAASSMPSEAQLTERDTLLRRVERCAQSQFDNCVVVAFGSAATGLWFPGSDLDICLLAPGIDGRRTQLHALTKLLRKLRREGASHMVQLVSRAQIPILRWAPRRAGKLACDISVNNVLAVANSRLLAHYMQVDARAPMLAFAAKTWARGRGINDRSRGTLSSFALSLMVVHFLQRRGTPVLPSLQDLAASRKSPPVIISGADCRYCSDPGQIRAELSRLRGDQPPNSEETGLLLHDFFRHFGYEYERGAIAIRSRGDCEKHEDEDQCFLMVDNPFEPGKDVANVEVHHYTRLREEFRRAHAMLHEGQSFQEVCQPPPPPGTCPLAGPVILGINTPMGMGWLPPAGRRDSRRRAPRRRSS